MPPCATCIEQNDRDTRQEAACGFLPSLEGAVPWHHEGMVDHGIEIETCPRYTTTLPDVVDVAFAHRHYEKGGLVSVEKLCGGYALPRPLIEGIEKLDSAVAERDAWKLAKKGKGGGDGA